MQSDQSKLGVVAKPFKVRLDALGENVLEPAFDAQPLHVLPHFVKLRGLVEEVMDLRCPVPFNHNHRIGIA